MNYRDFVKAYPNISLFGLLEKTNSLKFLGSLKETDIEKLDQSFLFDNGGRCFTWNNETMILDTNANDFMTFATNAIANKFSDKWSKIYELYSKTTPLGESGKETFSQTTDNTGSNVNDSTTTNAISAYDSDTFVNDNQSTINGNIRSNANENVEYTKTTTSFQAMTQTVDLLTNQTLYDIIYSDIRTYLFRTTI